MAKLLKLSLQNYRNLKNAEIVFGGKDGKIVGANRIGKTNVLEAICYLLTDKLLGGSADIQSIKNHEEPRAKVVVEGVFSTENGEVTLRKEFYEKWVRPRQAETEELQGHATDYYINGAKQARAKDFFDKLGEKFGIPTTFEGLDAYQLNIDPFYLGETICGSKDWKLARKAIIALIGDVTPQEIFQANPNAAIARADLESHQYDDGEAKKAIRGEIDGFKKKMIESEGLIAEYSRVADIDEAEYKDAAAKIDEISEQIANLKNGFANPFAEEITALQNELYEKQTEFQKQAFAKIDHTKSEDLRAKLMAKQDELAKAEREARSVEADTTRLVYRKNNLQDELNDIRAKLTAKQAEFQSVMVEDVCPTCGQPLPEEMREEAKNRKKAQIKDEASKLHEKGVSLKKEIEEAQSQILALSARDFDGEISKLRAEFASLQDDLAKARREENASVKEPDPAIKGRIAEINARLSEIKASQDKAMQDVGSETTGLVAKRETYRDVVRKREAYENAQRRLGEIKQQNVRHGKQQAAAEQRLWAVGEFVRTKLELFDSKMAKKFGNIRFQLIKENLKAGSYDEVCVPYIVSPATNEPTGTLFPDGSKSEQIHTGIQIIKAIRNLKGWSPLPVLFDQGGELDTKTTGKVAYDAEAQIIEVKVEGNGTAPTFVPFDN